MPSEKLLGDMIEYFSQKHKCSITYYNSKKEESKQYNKLKNTNNLHVIPFVASGKNGIFTVENPTCTLEAGTLQEFLDKAVTLNPSAKVDYIHGDNVIEELAVKEGNTGFYLPTLDKHTLFKTVIKGYAVFI